MCLIGFHLLFSTLGRLSVLLIVVFIHCFGRGGLARRATSVLQRRGMTVNGAFKDPRSAEFLRIACIILKEH